MGPHTPTQNQTSQPVIKQQKDHPADPKSPIISEHVEKPRHSHIKWSLWEALFLEEERTAQCLPSCSQWTLFSHLGITAPAQMADCTEPIYSTAIFSETRILCAWKDRSRRGHANWNAEENVLRAKEQEEELWICIWGLTNAAFSWDLLCSGLCSSKKNCLQPLHHLTRLQCQTKVYCVPE